jgi:hypothetical protein
VFRDINGCWFGAAWIKIANVQSKLSSVARVDQRVALGSAFADARSSISIREAVQLGSGEGFFFDEDALPLIPIAGAAKADEHCPKRGIAAGPPSESCVAGRQEHEMSEIGARETKRALMFEAKPPAFAQFLSALRAG